LRKTSPIPAPYRPRWRERSPASARSRSRSRWPITLSAAADVIRRVAAADWGDGVLVNINFPARPEPLGVRVTTQGFRDYGHIRIDSRVDPRGFPYYWFGYGREVETPGHRTDLEAVREGFVSVTPLHLDLTHRETIPALKATLEP
jgi:5'-nucleotidase